MNPFGGKQRPVTEAEKLFGRAEAWKLLEDRMQSQTSTVIVGVEGSGKTSLLTSFFDREYRIRMAKEKQTLISPITEFPTKVNSDSTYHHLADMVTASVRILSQCGLREDMDDILAQLEQIRMTSSSAASRFSQTLSAVHDTYGYLVVMVMDNFERFTSSKEVTMAHHELMRELLEKSQYIVATNYDLHQDSLPRGVRGSYLLMNFASSEIKPDLTTWEVSKKMLLSRMEGEDVQFSDELIKKLHNISGGIPELLYIAAYWAYAYIEQNGTEEGLKLRKDVYADERVQRLLKNWCLMLSPAQVATVKEILSANGSGRALDEEMKTAAATLRARGFLNRVDGVYQGNCELLDRFCIDGDKLEAAAAENPLKDMQLAETESVDVVDKLKARIEDGTLGRTQMMELLQLMARFVPDITLNIDMSEELTDEILEKYYLTTKRVEQWDEKVQLFLHNGVQIDRCFANVTLPGFDYSPIYISFCKAIETHLNQTLVPVLKHVLADYVIDYHHRPTRLADVPGTLMLGTIDYILKYRGEGCVLSNKDALVAYCARNGLNRFTKKWWDDYISIFRQIPDIRNECPHCGILEDKRGKYLLQLLFVGSDAQATDGQNGFFECSTALNFAAKENGWI